MTSIQSITTPARHAAADIKLAHSVFALPFAILAAFLARNPDTDWKRFGGQLVVVVICMFFARTWAMMVNRLADHRFDADNPRTAGRAIAAGNLSVRHAGIITIVAASLFIAAASLFWFIFSNPWPPILAVPVLVWIAFYSFTKRFTSLCHIFLGGALAASPIAAAIAINPGALNTTPAVWWLSAMVLLWVGGFDVIYALADIDFDRESGLHSIPATLGPAGAITASRLLHAGALGALIMSAVTETRFAAIYALAVTAVAALLVGEHAVLAKRGEKGLDMAFFTFNGVIACVLGAAGVTDILV